MQSFFSEELIAPQSIFVPLHVQKACKWCTEDELDVADSGVKIRSPSLFCFLFWSLGHSLTIVYNVVFCTGLSLLCSSLHFYCYYFSICKVHNQFEREEVRLGSTSVLFQHSILSSQFLPLSISICLHWFEIWFELLCRFTFCIQWSKYKSSISPSGGILKSLVKSKQRYPHKVHSYLWG